MTQAAHADWVRRIYCPVYGRDVTLVARWDDSAHDNPQHEDLLDFACRSNGMCGMPSWDPCPLYVKLRENGPAQT
jgi:hypothetical protein